MVKVEIIKYSYRFARSLNFSVRRGWRLVKQQTWLWRRAVLRNYFALTCRIVGISHSSDSQNAALIFARSFWNPSQLHHRVGSGRMQQEVFSCLQTLGFQTHFAGQEDKEFSCEVIDADLVVSLALPVAHLPFRCSGLLLVYTCNTHVLERTSRLQDASKRWNLPLEPDSFRSVEDYLVAYERADYLLIAENDQGISNFIKHEIPLKKIKRYNNCVDVDVWKPAAVKRNKFSFICYSSAHGLRKGLPALLVAWQKWYHEQDAELHLIGSSSIVSDQLLGNVKFGEVRPGIYVQLEGFPAQHPPIIKLIGSCHVAVFPTLEDAQPSSLLEMASCGLPVITTVESGVEFKSDFCYYVKADSVEDLCEAFEYWYSQCDIIIEIGQKARNFIIANHSWPCFRQRFSSIIREVTANKNIRINPDVIEENR